MTKEQDQKIKSMKDQINDLRDELAAEKEKPPVITPISELEQLGISLFKNSEGNFEIVKLGFSATGDNARVISRENVGKDFHMARYKTDQIYQMEIILGRK